MKAVGWRWQPEQKMRGSWQVKTGPQGNTMTPLEHSRELHKRRCCEIALSNTPPSVVSLNCL